MADASFRRSLYVRIVRTTGSKFTLHRTYVCTSPQRNARTKPKVKKEPGVRRRRARTEHNATLTRHGRRSTVTPLAGTRHVRTRPTTHEHDPRPTARRTSAFRCAGTHTEYTPLATYTRTRSRQATPLRFHVRFLSHHRRRLARTYEATPRHVRVHDFAKSPHESTQSWPITVRFTDQRARLGVHIPYILRPKPNGSQPSSPGDGFSLVTPCLRCPPALAPWASGVGYATAAPAAETTTHLHLMLAARCASAHQPPP